MGPSKRKAGRPTGGSKSNESFVDMHPELQTNYMELQAMEYDSVNEIERNKIQHLISKC